MTNNEFGSAIGKISRLEREIGELKAGRLTHGQKLTVSELAKRNKQSHEAFCEWLDEFMERMG